MYKYTLMYNLEYKELLSGYINTTLNSISTIRVEILISYLCQQHSSRISPLYCLFVLNIQIVLGTDAKIAVFKNRTKDVVLLRNECFLKTAFSSWTSTTVHKLTSLFLKETLCRTKHLVVFMAPTGVYTGEMHKGKRCKGYLTESAREASHYSPSLSLLPARGVKLYLCHVSDSIVKWKYFRTLIPVQMASI